MQPVVVELHPLHVEPVEAERMDVVVARPHPVDELDAELVGRVGRADELMLVEAEHGVEQVDLRDRRLADADVPISSDSTSSIPRPVSPMILEIAAAAIQPAVPPPTITTFSIGVGPHAMAPVAKLNGLRAAHAPPQARR